MSQAGDISRSAIPTGNVETLSDNGGNKASPDVTGNIAVTGINSAYTREFANGIGIYGSPSFLVDASGFAPYVFIGQAITAAVAAGASASNIAEIVVKPGSYNENLTIPAGIKITSWDSVSVEMNSTSSSTTRLTAVQLTGSVLFTGTNSSISNMGIYPTGTNVAIECNTNSLTFYLNNIKTFPNNASTFSISSSITNIICNNCSFEYADGSTTDNLYSGTGNGNLYLVNCYCNSQNASVGVEFNHYFTNSIIETFFNLASTTGLATFFLQNSEIILPLSASDLITGSSTSFLQITAYNSALVTSGTNAIVTSNASSFLKLFNCRVQGLMPLNLSIMEIVDTAYRDNAGNEQMLNVSTTNIPQLFVQNTGSSDSILSAKTGSGNAYERVVLDTSATYATGVNSVGLYKLNYTNSGTGTLSTGTNILSYNPSTNTYSINVNFQSSGGFGFNYTNPGSYPYTVLISDSWISVNTSSTANTITLPNPAGFVGQIFYVKDRTGNASTNNITVVSTINIDGGLSFVMPNNYEERGFLYNGSTYEVE